WLTLTPPGAAPTARHHAAGAPVTFGGVAGVLVTGGRPSGVNTPVAATEFFSPVTGWSTLAANPAPAYASAAAPATIGGVPGVLVAGGADVNNTPLAGALFYNPSTGGWSPQPGLPT